MFNNFAFGFALPKAKEPEKPPEPKDFKETKELSDDEREHELDQDALFNTLTFGWMEDGRLGFEPDLPSFIQTNPRPVTALHKPQDKKTKQQFFCRKASAGSRHTLYLMANHRPEPDRYASDKKTKKLMISGLNQLALCEEPGFNTPEEVDWEKGDEPKHIIAAHGNSFVITRFGNVYSWGFGRYGVLGHCEDRTCHIPRQILTLQKVKIKQLATGAFHVVALSTDHKLYSWGRNDKGQLGRGFESPMEVVPAEIEYFDPKNERPHMISAGLNHTILLLRVRTLVKGVDEEMRIFAWGDGSRGQLGSGSIERRATPQENIWVTRYMKNLSMSVTRVAAGGHHNMLLTNLGQNVIVWGANDYGQLGLGHQWDDPRPNIIPELRGIVMIAAGLRHSFAVQDHGTSDLWAWGYNGYGELGLGDSDMRIQPTKVTAIRSTRVVDISTGDRHTVLVISHKPMLVRENPPLKPFFAIAESTTSAPAIRAVKRMMFRNGFDASLLDRPNEQMPGQVGLTSSVVRNDVYEKGLRYCMDTFVDPADWRRKTYETAFETYYMKKHLKSICLACARQCMKNQRLRAYIRHREPGDICDCRLSGKCICAWSRIRGEFDKIGSDDDGCIGPRQFRGLLTTLRAPDLVEKEDMDDCLACFTEDSVESSDLPRVTGRQFENWYREYFDEHEEENELHAKLIESQKKSVENEKAREKAKAIKRKQKQNAMKMSKGQVSATNY